MGNTNMKNIPNKKFMKKYRSDSPMPHMKGNFKRKLLEGPIGWYRVTVSVSNLILRSF